MSAYSLGKKEKDEMTRIHKLGIQAALFTIAAAFYCTPASALDVAAAKKLVRGSGCEKCHVADKDKDGPAWKTTAEKYRNDAQAVEKLAKHLTERPEVTFPDGHKEDHKAVKATDEAQIKNLIEWIRSH
ncbi:MAG: c-type cytochrome [Azoarcus sp.]|jgi:cytochrome c|nr:c-type cytochrome [Azoarcus sp.]